MLGKNLLHLIRRHRIQTAAEGIELYQIDVIPRSGKISRPVQSGMIHPLIQNPYRPFQVPAFCHRRFCQYGKSEGRDDLIDAVIDLRIQMIRSARQDDGIFSVLLYVIDNLIRAFSDISFESRILFSACTYSFPHFGCPDSQRRHLFRQPLRQPLIVVIRQKRMQQFYSGCFQFIIHISGDHFRIHSHDRTVIVIVGLLIFDHLIVDARIKDSLHSRLDQRLDMSVDEFRRITGCIGGYGIHAFLVNLLRGSR